MRKVNWVPPALVAVALFGYFVAWPWYRDRAARGAADALIADLAEHGGRVEQTAASLPPVPDRPTKPELEAQLTRLVAELGEATERSSGLIDRAKVTIPQTPADAQGPLRQALERYTARVRLALDAYKARVELLRKRVEELQPGAGS